MSTETTTTTDEYNGWPNRETWAVNLWLGNDQDLYQMTLEALSTAAIEARMEDFEARTGLEANEVMADNYAGEAISELVEQLLNNADCLIDDPTRSMMSRDVGSLWRVDWRLIGHYWLEIASEQVQDQDAL